MRTGLENEKWKQFLVLVIHNGSDIFLKLLIDTRMTFQIFLGFNSSQIHSVFFREGNIKKWALSVSSS